MSGKSCMTCEYLNTSEECPVCDEHRSNWTKRKVKSMVNRDTVTQSDRKVEAIKQIKESE